MDELAKKYKRHKVASIFIYTHEAHPGEYYPHHRTMEQKIQHALAFKDIFNIERPVLVDRLSGDCHISYGSMPNMSWILDRRGRPLYKADWTNSASIESALENLVKPNKLHGAQKNRTPFNVHRMEFRTGNLTAFLKALERNGPKAVREFKEQMERWKTHREKPMD